MAPLRKRTRPEIKDARNSGYHALTVRSVTST
jgi:hypothetical protein